MGRPRGAPSTVVSVFLPIEDVARLDAALAALAALRKGKAAESRSSVLRPYFLEAVEALERRVAEAAPPADGAAAPAEPTLEAALQQAEYDAVKEWQATPAPQRVGLASLVLAHKDEAMRLWALR
jgi:hypothetical protein